MNNGNGSIFFWPSVNACRCINEQINPADVARIKQEWEMNLTCCDWTVHASMLTALWSKFGDRRGETKYRLNAVTLYACKQGFETFRHCKNVFTQVNTSHYIQSLDTDDDSLMSSSSSSSAPWPWSSPLPLTSSSVKSWIAVTSSIRKDAASSLVIGWWPCCWFTSSARCSAFHIHTSAA